MAKTPKLLTARFDVIDTFGSNHSRWIAGPDSRLELVQRVEYRDNVGDTVFAKTVGFQVILRGLELV